MSAEPSSAKRGSPIDVDLESGSGGDVVEGLDATGPVVVTSGNVVVRSGRSVVRRDPVATGWAAPPHAELSAITASAASTGPGRRRCRLTRRTAPR